MLQSFDICRTARDIAFSLSAADVSNRLSHVSEIPFRRSFFNFFFSFFLMFTSFFVFELLAPVVIAAARVLLPHAALP
jgi:hypothetical protein